MKDLKNFKMIVSDFDGTLVGVNLKPSEKVKELVKKLVDSGYFFSIATGRLYQGVIKSVCKDLNLTSPQITSGGSQIIDPKTDNILWSKLIAADDVKEVMRVFLDNNYKFAVESQGTIFTPEGLMIKEYGPGVLFKKLEVLDINAVFKIVLEGSKLPNLPEIAEELSKRFPSLHTVRSGMKGSPVLDITSIKATKYLAVLELSKILNIDPKLMIGIGDGFNDYPLLSACGFKVAMESGPKELKEFANLIVPDATKDGIVALIDKII